MYKLQLEIVQYISHGKHRREQVLRMKRVGSACCKSTVVWGGLSLGVARRGLVSQLSRWQCQWSPAGISIHGPWPVCRSRHWAVQKPGMPRWSDSPREWDYLWTVRVLSLECVCQRFCNCKRRNAVCGSQINRMPHLSPDSRLLVYKRSCLHRHAPSSRASVSVPRPRGVDWMPPKRVIERTYVSVAVARVWAFRLCRKSFAHRPLRSGTRQYSVWNRVARLLLAFLRPWGLTTALTPRLGPSVFSGSQNVAAAAVGRFPARTAARARFARRVCVVWTPGADSPAESVSSLSEGRARLTCRFSQSMPTLFLSEERTAFAVSLALDWVGGIADTVIIFVSDWVVFLLSSSAQFVPNQIYVKSAVLGCEQREGPARWYSHGHWHAGNDHVSGI